MIAAWMAAGLGCTGLASGDDEPFAIVFVNPPTNIQIDQTLPITARALNRGGDTIAGAMLELFAENPDTLVVDAAAGTITGRLAGAGRLVASAPNDVLGRLTVTVVAP